MVNVKDDKLLREKIRKNIYHVDLDTLEKKSLYPQRLKELRFIPNFKNAKQKRKSVKHSTHFLEAQLILTVIRISLGT